VPILPDDTAREVLAKVTVAAEIALDRVLPALVAGTAPRLAQDPAAASYFGARTPADGTIDWNRDATAIHNLVRAVAPPYPGALTAVAGIAARLLRTRIVAPATPPTLTPTLGTRDGGMFAHCGGGGTLAVLALEIGGVAVDVSMFAARFGRAHVALGGAACR
jgi:methionyl-tRNA formyltransferase